MNELDICFNEALEYMSFEEYIDLCSRIIDCYKNKKKSREETKEEN